MAERPTRALIATLGLPDADLHALPYSPLRFPDGAHYRVEIPSTEGPRPFRAVLDEAARLDVPVVRVSQGSGVFMHTDAELDEFASLGRGAGVEVIVPMHYDTFAANLGFPAHLVDVVRRDHPTLAVLVPTRDRPVLYAKARTNG